MLTNHRIALVLCAGLCSWFANWTTIYGSARPREQPYHENYVHYNWHWFWDFGNGEIGNQGVHQMDIARWAMPDGAVPKSVISLGGRFGYKDQGQTPNTQLTIIDFGGAEALLRGPRTGQRQDEKVTNEFYTDEGVIKDGKFFPKGRRKASRSRASNSRVHPGAPFRNFIDCVRSRKREDLNAEILEGHLSSLLAHLGNISYRWARCPFNKETKAFGDDKAAYESFESMKQHLVDAAKLELAGATYRLGRSLQFDAADERFVGDDDANQLLTRPYHRLSCTTQYRKPIVLTRCAAVCCRQPAAACACPAISLLHLPRLLPRRLPLGQHVCCV